MLQFCLFKPRVYHDKNLYLSPLASGKKDKCLSGHDYMLHFVVTFLIREHTDAEDVEQVESQLVLVSEKGHFMALESFTYIGFFTLLTF